MSKEELYMLALSRYGMSAQITMVFEEFSELEKELCKFLRGKKDEAHIAEEIADCEIMIEQMKQFLSLGGRVEAWKAIKLARLETRLKEDIPDEQ